MGQKSFCCTYDYTANLGWIPLSPTFNYAWANNIGI